MSGLYEFVRPLGVKVTVTFNRATGNTDNPRCAVGPTPDGNPVGNLGMSLNTLEASGFVSRTCEPGKEYSFWVSPSVLLSLYNAVTNGYQAMKPGKLSLSNLPLVYYGDVLLSTPSINVTTVTQYVSLKVEFYFEFSELKPTVQ